MNGLDTPGVKQKSLASKIRVRIQISTQLLRDICEELHPSEAMDDDDDL